MKINEGNIFEAMRLVLPEYRSTMKRWQRQRNAKVPPMLSDLQLESMQQTISEAIQHGTRVRLTLFGEHDNTLQEGIPLFDGRLKVRTDEGMQIVDVRRLIRVEVL